MSGASADEKNYAALWADRKNWICFAGLPIFYYCLEDDRVLVPKSNPYLGWTINAGTRAGQASLAALALAGVGAVRFGVLRARKL